MESGWRVRVFADLRFCRLAPGEAPDPARAHPLRVPAHGALHCDDDHPHRRCRTGDPTRRGWSALRKELSLTVSDKNCCVIQSLHLSPFGRRGVCLAEQSGGYVRLYSCKIVPLKEENQM